MTTSTPPPATSKKRPWYKIWWVWVIIVALGIVGQVVIAGVDDSSTEASSTTTAEATTEEAVEETAVEEVAVEEEPKTTSAVAPIAPATNSLEAQCVPNDTLTQMIPGVLNDSTQTVGNGMIIDDGNDTWIGVTIFRADGTMESRSDVWLLRDGGLYSVSGGARNNSWAVKAPSDAHMGLDIAQAVDACVSQASIS
ncbi:hypothetical protein [Corynebacterium glutamicum]|uniref:hypothetical protein n=1 Tax=Corynebacterium glutamicum TaxID=1718 RepID=UPI00146812E5|nr:hypothetical protein [Corynebacterium glutamicum]GFK19313.1 hypothetical protein KbCgl_18850 [Corynebacterium glutamicum]